MNPCPAAQEILEGTRITESAKKQDVVWYLGFQAQFAFRIIKHNCQNVVKTRIAP